MPRKERRLRLVREAKRRVDRPDQLTSSRQTANTYHRLGRAARRRAEVERAFRAAILAASEEGWSTRRIGAAVGLSHTRVQQLIREARQ